MDIKMGNAMRTTSKILFLLPPNITFEDLVSPPGNISTIELKKTGQRLGSVITDIPLGIISLSAYLKKHIPLQSIAVDFNVRINQAEEFSDTNFRDYFRKELETPELLDFAPDFVAISAQFTPAYDSVIILAELAKEFFPEAMILGGGNLPTAMYREMLDESKAFDAICYGEGELPLLKLIQSEDREAFLEDSKSWVTHKKLLAQEHHYEHEFIWELDEIPFLDYGILDLDGYKLNSTLNRYSDKQNDDTTPFPVMTSRGCPFKCTFCASHNAHGRKMRYHSLPRVREDLERLKSEFLARKIVIQDDHFMGNRELAYGVVKAMHEKELAVFFQNALALYALDREFLQLLKDSGINELVLPVESGSGRVLKELMHKPLKPEIVQRVVKDCRDIGIFTDCNIIIGMPGETLQDIKDGRNFLRTLGGDWYRIFVATPIPGSDIFKTCIEKNYFKIHPLKANYKRAVIETESLNPTQIQEVSYEINLDINFVNNANFLSGRHSVALNSFLKVIDVKPDHAFAHYYAGLCRKALGDQTGYEKHCAIAKQIAGTDMFWQEMAGKFGLTDLVGH